MTTPNDDATTLTTKTGGAGMTTDELLKLPGVYGLAQLGRNALDELANLREENAKLRAELAAITQEVSQSGYLGGPSLSACVNAMAGRLKNLQSELAAIKAAPVVAIVRADYNHTDAWNFIDCDELPPVGTELIARPK